MRTQDLSPLFRASVGFDRVADMLDRVMTQDVGTSTYPPYNIEKIDENAYRISVAVAGFTGDELTVEQRENAAIAVDLDLTGVAWNSNARKDPVPFRRDDLAFARQFQRAVAGIRRLAAG